MVAVTKKNGMLHICLDPKDLNHAIRHEHYPLPTIEDVASCLYGAKLLNQARTGRRPARAWFLNPLSTESLYLGFYASLII